MPIIDQQKRFREIGRIRLGTKAVSQKSGKEYPVKLETFRLTSPSQLILEAAAKEYGGVVHQWDGAPTEGKQYELITTTDTFEILIPPGVTDEGDSIAISQWYELWSGGGCQRRCNGMAMVGGEACVCPADPKERAEAAKAKPPTGCSPTTRLSVILPKLPDIGVWRLETKGYNASLELPGTVDVLQLAANARQMIPAMLRLEQRTSKKDGETRHFVVPILELPNLSVADILEGRLPTTALESAEAPAITQAKPALEVGGGSVGDRQSSPPPVGAKSEEITASPSMIRSVERAAQKAGLETLAIVEEVTGKTSMDDLSVNEVNDILKAIKDAAK